MATDSGPSCRRHIARARALRREATFPERLLWGRLRGGRLNGWKFRRQHPVGPYIVDFYCHEVGLVVELDGRSHDGRVRQDRERTRWLEQHGLRVIRFTNDDVICDVGRVAEAILREIERSA